MASDPSQHAESATNDDTIVVRRHRPLLSTEARQPVFAGTAPNEESSKNAAALYEALVKANWSNASALQLLNIAPGSPTAHP